MHRGQFVPRSSHTVSIWALAAVGALSGGAQSFGAVTFSWADIGLAGNAADTTGFSAVANEFQISRYEVTNAQYAEFLNQRGRAVMGLSRSTGPILESVPASLGVAASAVTPIPSLQGARTTLSAASRF